jgi:hypothetical protein
MTLLEQLVSGKRVAVVGNAASLARCKHGAAIDAHDVVVRMNRAAPLFGLPNPEAYGARTDILMIKFENSSAVRGHVDRLRQEVPYVLADEHLAHVVPMLPMKLPSTGIRVLLGVLEAGGLVSAYGYDWKASPTLTNRKEYKHKHDFPAEREYCLNVLRPRGIVFHG